MASAWRADSLQLPDGARQTRTFSIRKVKLVPPDAIPVDAPGQGKAKMTDGERFDQGAGPKMKFRHHVVVVLAFGPQFLDPADDAAIAGAHLAAEQQLDAALSLSFRHDVLRESSR